MSDEHGSVEGALGTLAPVHDDELTEIAGGEGVRALFHEIVSLGEVVPARRSRRLPVAAMAAAAALAVGVLLALHVARPDVAGAGIGFETREDFLVARATDTSVGAEQMTAAFAERGLDVEVELTPTSPSLVGRVAGLDVENGQYDGVEILKEGRCWTPGGGLGGCAAGLLIPKDFAGQLRVIFGRAADPGERYITQGDVFAPGEDLHCHAQAVLNGDPEEVDQLITSLGVDIDWWKVMGSTRPDPLEGTRADQLSPELADGRFVQIVWGLSDGRVGVFLRNEPFAIESPEYLNFVDQGCGQA